MASGNKGSAGTASLTGRMIATAFLMLNVFTALQAVILIAMCVLQAVLWAQRKLGFIKVSHGGRELSKKEKKRCGIRFYIYLIMIGGSLLWAAFLFPIMDILERKNLTWTLYLLAGSVILDVFVIKTKNFKYLCSSYVKSDHDDHFKKVDN